MEGTKRPGSKHGIQEQNPSGCYVFRQFFIEESGLAGIFIPLDQNFTNSHRSATVTETLLHSFACAHDRDSAYFPLEFDPGISATDRRCDDMLNHRQMIETFFNQKANNPIRIKNEIGSCCGPVSNHSIKDNFRSSIIWRLA